MGKPISSNQSSNLLDRWDKISDEGLEDLTQSLCKLTSLTGISLNFAGYNKITDTGLDYLRQCFQKITSLIQTSLDLSRYINSIRLNLSLAE